MSTAWRVFFGTFEALRRLGYPSEDIYANCDGNSLFIMVQRHGGVDNEFQIRCGDVDKATYEAEYARFGKLWNEKSALGESRRQIIYDEWLNTVGGWRLIMTLKNNGLTMPCELQGKEPKELLN